MENWQTGDMEAFEAFFREHERNVFRNAYLITGNRDDADDVLQDVFTSVWKSRHTFDPLKGKASTWLHRITVNECLRKRRKDRPSVLRVDNDRLEVAAPPPAGQAAAEYEELKESLGRLDSRQRAILVLRYFNDMSYQEIADALSVPLGTVKSRINHAMGALRAKMKDPDDRL
jgi:RNA polymerase sigma-70 factor, ECF subfamily